MTHSLMARSTFAVAVAVALAASSSPGPAVRCDVSDCKKPDDGRLHGEIFGLRSFANIEELSDRAGLYVRFMTFDGSEDLSGLTMSDPFGMDMGLISTREAPLVEKLDQPRVLLSWQVPPKTAGGKAEGTRPSPVFYLPFTDATKSALTRLREAMTAQSDDAWIDVRYGADLRGEEIFHGGIYQPFLRTTPLPDDDESTFALAAVGRLHVPDEDLVALALHFSRPLPEAVDLAAVTEVRAKDEDEPAARPSAWTLGPDRRVAFLAYRAHAGEAVTLRVDAALVDPESQPFLESSELLAAHDVTLEAR